MDARISVIVPVYNVERYLARCVDSILAQTYSNLEVILVDDGAKDGSGAICDAYARADSRVRVIHKLNGGLSSARNAGIDIAEGDYLSFVDSDDWIEPDMLESMVNAAQKYDVRLVCAGRYDVSERTGASVKGLCPEKEEVISGKELVSRIFTWNHVDSAAWDKLYSRDLFRQIRYPVGKIMEDVPTTYRIALDAGKAVMLPKPVYNYYHRSGSITMSAVTEKNFHFSQHTQLILPYIREVCPELEKQARSLRIYSLAYNVLILDLADAATREKFEEEYAQSRKELRESADEILLCPYFNRRQKRDYLLMAYGLYRPMRQIYHLFKK